MGRTLIGGKFPARALVDPVLWKWIRKKAVDLDTDASELTELALTVLRAIIEAGRIPDDLGAILASRSPETLNRLRELLQAVRVAN